MSKKKKSGLFGKSFGWWDFILIMFLLISFTTYIATTYFIKDKTQIVLMLSDISSDIWRGVFGSYIIIKVIQNAMKD